VKKYLLLLLCITFISSLFSQSKRDYVWLFGSTPYKDKTGVKGNTIDFNSKGKIDSIRFYDTVWANNTEISDEEGNLLFYFNGCRIIDSTQNIMQNGGSINYGDMWKKYCGRFSTYPDSQNSIILPDSGNEAGYYLIHKTTELITEPEVYFHGELQYSYIDMNCNEGKG
jgi:hypothetical protein